MYVHCIFLQINTFSCIRHVDVAFLLQEAHKVWELRKSVVTSLISKFVHVISISKYTALRMVVKICLPKLIQKNTKGYLIYTYEKNGELLLNLGNIASIADRRRPPNTPPHTAHNNHHQAEPAYNTRNSIHIRAPPP